MIRLDSAHRAPGLWRQRMSRARTLLRCEPATLRTTLYVNGQTARSWDNPLAALAWMSSPAAELQPTERWVGFLAYDLGRLFEAIPSRAAEQLRTPLFAFAKVNEDAGDVDHKQATITREARANLRSTFTRREYLTAVERVIEYIRAGDVFQVNLSQRFTVPSTVPASEIYGRLQTGSPAWYGALLDFGDFALVSNSPELFLRVTRQPDGARRIVTRPIKGTRPKIPGLDEELRRSAKDQAELNMIIDLERNDLGRICEIGTVRVTEPRVIESHPTVYHGAATIEGVLRPDVALVDLLGATFPGGSVTGAPKVRAMQIIEELEPVRRGPYCGAIGYVAADGTIEFNVAIRTIILQDGLAHVSVGGGIVADSDPAAEYDETLVKARAMFDALGIPSPER